MEHHIFVCTRERDQPKPCCTDHGGKELWLKLKGLAKQNENVKVTATQCLGVCPNGVTVVVYPEGKWFICKDDVPPELLDILNPTK